MESKKYIKSSSRNTHPSSFRSVSMRNIGAAPTLYPAYTRTASTGMTKRVGHVNGFTLIELLVVVLIIGILAAVALPQYQKAVWKSRFTQAKTMAKSIAQAEEAYYMANGKYTADLDELSIDLATTSRTPDGDGAYTLNFKWGECTLVAWTTGRGDVQCFIKKNTNDRYLGYIHNFAHSKWSNGNIVIDNAILCTSLKNDSIADQICTAETGTKTKYTWGTNTDYRKYAN